MWYEGGPWKDVDSEAEHFSDNLLQDYKAMNLWAICDSLNL